MRKNIGFSPTGILYFYVHFVTELICFLMLGRYIASPPLLWLILLTYNMLAFVPQGIIGRVSDRFPKIPMAAPGLVFLAAALLIDNFAGLTFTSLIFLCLGNAMIHINGAEATLRTSNGRLTESAIFVSGGSFGVISGKLLSKTLLGVWPLILLVASAVPFVIAAQKAQNKAISQTDTPCGAFSYNNKSVNAVIVIFLSVFVVSVRGYMAYGIPTSWNKTTVQTVMLFVFMGLGKALGGLLSDLFGIRRVAFLSVLLALPFLLFGDNTMSVSLIGVLLFSMTMPITLAILVSVMQKTPGLAFGLTTIGLFFGSVPVFFVKIKSFGINCAMLTAATVICIVCFAVSLRKDNVCE